MRSFLLSNPPAVYKNELLYSSKGKNTSLYEIIFPYNQGLGAHIHTSGEDCALVLSGTLTYFVGNRETIVAEQYRVWLAKCPAWVPKPRKRAGAPACFCYSRQNRIGLSR